MAKSKDITGQKFGKLTALYAYHHGKDIHKLIENNEN